MGSNCVSETDYAYDGDSRLTAFASARGFVTSVDYGFAGQYLGPAIPNDFQHGLDKAASCKWRSKHGGRGKGARIGGCEPGLCASCNFGLTVPSHTVTT